MTAANPLGQLQPVHKWHLNIGNDHIRQQPVNGIRGFPSVLGLIHNLKPVLFPVDLRDNPFSYIFFVLGKYQFIHPSSLFESGLGHTITILADSNGSIYG
ncbi:hypothetical protein D3C75_736080 [compost metagenome]